MQSPEVTEYYNGKRRKCDWKGENGKQCNDRNFAVGNHYEIEEHIRSYHLHIEANEDDNVNDDGEGRGEGNGHEFDDDDPNNNEDAAMEAMIKNKALLVVLQVVRGTGFSEDWRFCLVCPI